MVKNRMTKGMGTKRTTASKETTPKKSTKALSPQALEGHGGRDLATSWDDLGHRWSPTFNKAKGIGPLGFNPHHDEKPTLSA
jgi:hypothetical protein